MIIIIKMQLFNILPLAFSTVFQTLWRLHSCFSVKIYRILGNELHLLISFRRYAVLYVVSHIYGDNSWITCWKFTTTPLHAKSSCSSFVCYTQDTCLSPQRRTWVGHLLSCLRPFWLAESWNDLIAVHQCMKFKVQIRTQQLLVWGKEL